MVTECCQLCQVPEYCFEKGRCLRDTVRTNFSMLGDDEDDGIEELADDDGEVNEDGEFEL